MMRVYDFYVSTNSLQKIVKKQNYPKAFIIFVKFGTQKLQNYTTT